MAIPMRLSCQLCKWKSRYDSLEDVMALYLFHMIMEHYSVIKQIHDNPEIQEALKLIL